jgi:ribosome-associated heat shock protein Hsp15
MRVDKLLWFLRLAASRSFAQDWVQAGHMRLNGRRIEKPSTSVACGDILTLPMRNQVKVIELVSFPTRRGPATQAQSCYRVLDDKAENLLAAGNSNAGTEGDLQP